MFKAHLLAPYAYARRPLVDRVAVIKVPVTFVCKYCTRSFLARPYSNCSFPDGDQDWMDPEGGAEAVENMKAAGNRRARMYIIRNAGHHGVFPFHWCSHLIFCVKLATFSVHLDNPSAVNELLLKELNRD